MKYCIQLLADTQCAEEPWLYNLGIMLGDHKNISDLLEMDTNHRNLKLKGTSRDYWIFPSVLGASEYSKTIPEAVCLHFSNSPIVWSLCPSRRVYCSYSWKAFCSIRFCLVYCNVDRFLIFSKVYKKQFSPHIALFSSLLPIRKVLCTSCFVFFSNLNNPLFFSLF